MDFLRRLFKKPKPEPKGYGDHDVEGTQPKPTGYGDHDVEGSKPKPEWDGNIRLFFLIQLAGSSA